MDKNISRLATQGYYNFQLVRLNFLNQIRDIVRKLNEDIAFDQVEDKKEEKKFDAKYSDSKLMDVLKKLRTENKIDEQTELFLEQCLATVQGGEVIEETTCPHCNRMFELPNELFGVKGIENEYKKLMAKTVKKELIYIEFLSKIRGCGPVHSANLLKAFDDCSGYPTISKLWAHSGYAVNNGVAPRRKKGEEIHYNPKLRTMIWKIGDNLMKQNKGIYRKTYNEYKEKQANREYLEGELASKWNGYKEEDTKLTKGHVHNRALRKMVKLFLSHFWEASRELAGLSTERTYVEGVLKHTHIIHWKEALELEGCLL